jgi:hypothetical protein
MITDVLDLIGLILLVAALGIWAGATFGLPVGLAAAGVSVLFVSWFIDRRRK